MSVECCECRRYCPIDYYDSNIFMMVGTQVDFSEGGSHKLVARIHCGSHKLVARIHRGSHKLVAPQVMWVSIPPNNLYDIYSEATTT